MKIKKIIIEKLKELEKERECVMWYLEENSFKDNSEIEEEYIRIRSKIYLLKEILEKSEK
jgi:hypothetical protein